MAHCNRYGARQTAAINPSYFVFQEAHVELVTARKKREEEQKRKEEMVGTDNVVLTL